MLTFIYNLIVGNFCLHSWEIIKEVEVNSDLIGQYTEYHLQCKHCGNIKKKACR